MKSVTATIISIFLLALICCSSSFAAPLTDPKDLELIRTLLAHNRAELEKITSFWFEYEWESVSRTEGYAPVGMPAGTCVMKGKAVYVRKGDWYRYSCTFRREILGTDYLEEDQTQSILTDNYLVVIPSHRIESIRYVDIDSLDDMPEQDRHLSETIIAPDILVYGFDKGVYGISRRIRPQSTKTKWSVRQSSDGRTYTITEHSVRDIVTEYTISADQGYLITRQHVQDKAGTTRMELTVEPMLVDGIWVPGRIETVEPINSKDDRSSVKLTKAEINKSIPESTFNWETLDFDRAKARLQKIVPGHDPVYLIFREGQWVPEEYALK